MSVRLRYSAAFFALLACALPCAAQSIGDVYRLARENDPRYRGAQADFRASEQVLEQAKAGFWPTIRLDYDQVRTRQTILQSNNPIFGAGTTKFPADGYAISLNQPIFRKDLLERLEQARASVRQSHFTMLAAEQDLMQRTASAYLSVLAARDSLDLARAEKDAVRKQLDLAETRLKQGLGTVTSLHDAAARYAVDQAREIEAENKLEDARQALKEIVGRDIEAYQRLRRDVTLTPPQPASLTEWITGAMQQNLSLRARTEAVEVAFQEKERQRAGYFPSVSLIGNQNQRNSGSTLFGGGSNVETQEITLRLSVPLFEGGMTGALTAEAVQRHQKAKEDRELERRAVERQTRAAYQALVSGIGLVRALQQSVESQQSALTSKELGLQRGLFTVLAVLDAQRDLFAARRDHSQARYDYLLNSIRLKQAAGVLTENDISLVNAAMQ